MRFSNRDLLSAVIGVLGVIWYVVVFSVTGHFAPIFPYKGALTFVLVAVTLAILYLSLFRRSPGRQAAEAGALPVYLTFAYVGAVMCSNTALILTGHGGFTLRLLLCNLVSNTVYILLILYAEKDVQRLSEQLDRTEQALSGSLILSEKLGKLLALAEDGPVRARLLKLKEAVDYSTNVSTEATLVHERQMASQLDELMALLSRPGEDSAVQDKLREAERTWSVRNSAAASKG